ncbi:arsenate reductase (azurin) small subunit [Halomonas alkalisoli]|uniref:arsenate reductase (azurin) small subunit n=1 Tax=Halomonas alkalisoli TaxID=2907158 RepID=UPI001F41A498|nr:arsenate reductase (azurin) small subunit [Halomonas alkalisoli]MCE9682499.1 arsenate reductase (azurin) small subunit [Halomonas alkalisoli]
MINKWKKKIETVAAEDHSPEGRHCMSRRGFLLGGGAVVSVAVMGAVSGSAFATTQKAIRAEYPRVHIGKLSQLETGKPVDFAYPYPSVNNQLIKLGEPAGGGVGDENDIVAFNTTCPHMGGPLHGTYKQEHALMGPCPLHLTTFDLSRHGMVTAGQATESLPQIVLETEGDDIYAVAVMGLIYGYSNNLERPA